MCKKLEGNESPKSLLFHEKKATFYKEIYDLKSNFSTVLDLNDAPRCIIEDKFFRPTNLMNLHLLMQLKRIAVAFHNVYALKQYRRLRQLKRTIFNKHFIFIK